MILRRDEEGLRLLRNIYFDRYTLQISRQKTFDAVGGITSDTRYSDWKTYDGIPFPSVMDIQRPQDGYELNLSIITMKINTPDVTAQKFVLNQPPNTQLKEMK
jgi:outer membrane lipoprotein-sorting protein